MSGSGSEESRAEQDFGEEGERKRTLQLWQPTTPPPLRREVRVRRILLCSVVYNGGGDDLPWTHCDDAFFGAAAAEEVAKFGDFPTIGS